MGHRPVDVDGVFEDRQLALDRRHLGLHINGALVGQQAAEQPHEVEDVLQKGPGPVFPGPRVYAAFGLSVFADGSSQKLRHKWNLLRL